LKPQLVERENRGEISNFLTTVKITVVMGQMPESVLRVRLNTIDILLMGRRSAVCEIRVSFQWRNHTSGVKKILHNIFGMWFLSDIRI